VILCALKYNNLLKYIAYARGDGYNLGKQTVKEVRSYMATITEPNHAFVLNPQKADAFLKQDNKQFRKAMDRFEKNQKQCCHSNVNK
jgi:predicted phosphohydrolase